MVQVILDSTSVMIPKNIKLTKNELIEAVLLYIEHVCHPEVKVLAQIRERKYYYLPQAKTYQLEGSSVSIEVEYQTPIYDLQKGTFVNMVRIIMSDQDSETSIKIETIISDAVTYYEDCCRIEHKDNIGIYVYNSGYWKNTVQRIPRTFDTIYLDQKHKDRISQTIHRFTSEQEEYERLGIPYKLNMLFAGTPGMGKTTLAMVIASLMKRNIYIINFTGKVDDTGLTFAINDIPEKSILLLEDIDCLFVERKVHDNMTNNVSFSGLLNILDGQLAKTGLVTIITTNFADRLDCALKRPGRVDLMIQFDFASEEQITEMFNKFYPTHPEWFKPFYEQIKGLKITIATLQQFFFYVVGRDHNPNDFMRQFKANFGELNQQGVTSSDNSGRMFL